MDGWIDGMTQKILGAAPEAYNGSIMDYRDYFIRMNKNWALRHSKKCMWEGTSMAVSYISMNT